MHMSIVKSSDIYYYMVANDLGVERAPTFHATTGLRPLVGIDVEGETPACCVDRVEGEALKQSGTAANHSIGHRQGYNAFTLLQLAHATATVANDACHEAARGTCDRGHPRPASGA